MIKGMLNWFKALSEGWKIFLAVSGLVTLISTGSVKIDRWRTRNTTNQATLNYLSKSDSARKVDDKTFRDYLFLRLRGISDTLFLVLESQQDRSTSEVLFLQDNKKILNDFMGSMDGYEFTLIIPSTGDPPERKIKITKVKK